jgi:GNAT superfamily N-acetyltransferase
MREHLAGGRTAVEFRRATPDDFGGILRLQADNFIGNLTVERQQEGFLSAELTPDQLALMARDLAVLIAHNQDRVVGYLCAATIECCRSIPLVEAMLRSFDHVRYEDRLLSAYRFFIYGPVCIDRAYRGKGLLVGLYRQLLQAVTDRFKIGVALIAKANSLSLHAHVTKLHMVAVGEFEFAGHGYVTLAFRVQKNRHPS